jgi:HD-GYP domain-containing protein (c-di-GMP phosphodiesterase class II)
VRASHERWDGNGYPDRLAGEEIPLAARVISACDAFNAMTSDRPYRAAMDDADAIAELRRGSGNQFDPDVIDVLVSLLGVEEPSSTHRSGMPVHG